MINWTATPDEHAIIRAIAQRTLADDPAYPDFQGELMMDLEATHCNGCPLNLRGLLNAPKADFMHDVWGIRKHLDRTTGQLTGCFLPRYAVAKPLDIENVDP